VRSTAICWWQRRISGSRWATDVDVVVLGAHGTWPPAGGATSGLLVRHDGTNVLLDVGTGTLARLQEHVGLFDVDAVFVSHSHPDHVADLYAYVMARMFSPEHPPRIPLYVAPKVLERFAPLLQDDSGDMDVNDVFDVQEVDFGEKLNVGPLEVTTASMRHSVPTFAVRVEAEGAAMAYSADTGPTEDLVTLASGAQLLVAEASWQEAEQERPPIHLTAREAGEAGARAGAGRLVLTHIRPHLDRDLSRQEASTSFGGEVLVGTEGQVLELG
jgi:ribonuclease BN (tRNA processing enzyme)